MQEQKGSFLWRNRVVLAGGVLLLLAAHFISSGLRQGRLLARPQAYVIEALRPFASAFSRASWSAHDLVHQYLWLSGVARDNQRLHQQLAALPALEAQLHELQLENQHLSELLSLKDALGLRVVGAAVIGSDATGLARTLMLNQGAAAGVRPGMGVIATAGAVGKILATSPQASRVILLNDHNCAIDVFDQRTRARGIVTGVVDDGAVMRYVERTEDVKPGDTLITSGLDGAFPRGVLVGYISKVRRQGPGLFMNVSIKPAVSFRTLEQVLVIVETPPHLVDPDQG